MSKIDEPEAVPASTVAPATQSGAHSWIIALGGALTAAVLAWGLGEATLIPEVGFSSKKTNVDISPRVAGTRNTIISFGALGAVAGLSMGIAGGLMRRSVFRAVSAGVAGLVLGGIAGAAVPQFVLPIYYKNSLAGDMIYSLMVHGGTWGAIGAAAGLAFAIGLGGWHAVARGLVGGVAGALLATVIYEFAGGLLFTDAMTDRPISQTAVSRLLARLLVTVFIAAGLVAAAAPPPPVATIKVAEIPPV